MIPGDTDVLAGIDRRFDALHAALTVTTIRRLRPVHSSVRTPFTGFLTVVATAIAVFTILNLPSQPAPEASNTPSQSEAASVSAAVNPATNDPSATASRPLNPAIAPVSRSSPGQAAQRAMDLCGVDRYGFDAVAGMGLVPDARDIPEYVPVGYIDIARDANKAGWVVAFQGWIRVTTRTVNPFREYKDPTCVVIDDVPQLYVTGPQRINGVITTPPPSTVDPSYSLPSLAP